MQNDRNVSSDDNKNAVSLDNIIDEYGSDKESTERKSGEKLNEAMKKLDEMFNQEAEDLAWLDNIMNGNAKVEGGNTQNTVSDTGYTEENAVAGNIIGSEQIVPEEEAASYGIGTATKDMADASFGSNEGNMPADDNITDVSVDTPYSDGVPFNADEVRSDITVMQDEIPNPKGEQPSEVVLEDDIFADNNGFVSDAEIDTQQYEDVIRAENPDNAPDLDAFSDDDDTKIFTSSHNVQIPQEENEDYSEWENGNGAVPGELSKADRKLEKKRLKEEKRLAKAQAKAQAKALKAQQNNGVGYMNEQGMPTDVNVMPADMNAYQAQQGVPVDTNDASVDIDGYQNQQGVPADMNGTSGNVNDYPEQQGMPLNEASDLNNDTAAVNGDTEIEAQDELPADIYQDRRDDSYSYEENNENNLTNGAPEDGGTPDFEMFEGTEPEGEYVHNMEVAAQQHENNVNSSLGKLFGVDIPDEDNDGKSAKKKSEHKKIAKELGAYEEINMADPDAVNAARRRYFVKRRRSMISLFGVTFFFLAGLYFELSMLGVLPVPEIVSATANPVMFALVNLQLMCFGAMFVIDSLIGGFYAILDRRFSPASCALTVFITCAAQAVVSAVFGGAVKLDMFCCIGCFSLFMLALYDSLRASADYKSFSIASSTANKYGAYELGVDSLECSPFASHIDLEKAKVISVNKGSVYEGFVGRNERRPEGEKKLGRLTLIIMVISILVGVFVAFFSDGGIKERVYEGITGAAIVITSSIPFNVFFVSALPKYLAVKKGNKIGATLIGQNASEEYKGLSVVAFEDTEVFLPKDVRISSIKTYGGMALDEAVITMSSIYNKIGGPLSKIFSKMVDMKNNRSEVRLVKVYPDAIEVNVDGRDFCLATASYLGANGIRIINDSVDAAFEQSHGSILFMVCQGRVLSKFYIKYAMNPIFEKTLRELHDANLCIGIKTLDPCITNDLVFGCLERANYALSVIKGNSSNDIPTVRNKVNSGVISLGSVHSFLEMLLVCEKTGRNVKINNVIKLIGAILCIGLSTVFVLTNNGSLNIIFCLLIQLFWLLPVTAVSYLNR